MSYYLSLGYHTSIDFDELSLRLGRSAHYLESMGFVVYNPCELFSPNMSLFFRWLLGLSYLVKGESVVFPPSWKVSVYSRIDFALCRILRKNVMFKYFD